MSSRLSPKLREAWANFLKDYPLNIFHTVKFPYTEDYPGEEIFRRKCREVLDKYYMFVSNRCFGNNSRAKNKPTLNYITFFEDESKFGGDAVLHAHSLIESSEENYSRIIHYLNSEWKKVGRPIHSPAPFIEKIEGLRRLTFYVTKFAGSDHEIMFSLPSMGKRF